MTGDELRAWRESLDWTMVQAGRYLGTTKTSVYRWEVGRYPVPPTIAILALLLRDVRNRRSVETFLFQSLDT